MAASRAVTPIFITSLRGGVNDNDPASFLSPDQVVLAENIEYYLSTLGERRRGCTAISLPAAITADANITTITWMGRHLPDPTLGTAEFWAFGQSLSAANNVLIRRTQTAWSTIVPNDAITSTTGYGSKIAAISLHQKFFFAYKSSVDFLHVFDGSSLRKVGMGAPAAPTAADSGGAGALAGTRYYRVRYVVLSGATVLRRSEPSTVLTFTPSGANASITVTKPATTSEGETHWELEASTDNANFYMISRQVVATTTYVDATVFATGYAGQGVLSELLTAYTRIPSGKFLTADSDRLIIGGSFENTAYASRIWWTPVFGATGVGNDERVDMTVNPYIDLDGFEGGELTGISRPVNGYLYAFKWSHIYKVIRTGQLTSAYTAIPMTKSRGAFPLSLVEAVDQAGNPAQYFLDPAVGPMRIGNYGLEWLGKDLVNTWARVNQSATVPCHGVFYRAKNQVHFWIAVDGADYPNMKIIVHCAQIQSGPNGGQRGWVTVPVGDRIADAYCSLTFSDNIDSTDVRNQMLVPFIGKKQWTVGGVTIKDLIQRCDATTTDAFTTGDTDAYYYGKVTTKPFSPASLLSEFGLMSGVLVLAAVSQPSNNVFVEAVRDYGQQSVRVQVDPSPSDGGLETVVVKPLDSLSFASMKTLQLSFGDLDTNLQPTMQWSLHQFIAKVTGEQTY